MVAGVLGLSGLIVVAWATFVHDPLGGEPVAVVTTTTPGAPKVARDADSDGKQHARYDGPQSSAPVTPPPPEPPPGSKTVTIIDGSSGARQQVTIPGNSGAAAALLDPKLLETTRQGTIPKIGPDGTRPSARYAHPRQLSSNKKEFTRHRDYRRRPRDQCVGHCRCIYAIAAAGDFCLSTLWCRPRKAGPSVQEQANMKSCCRSDGALRLPQ